MYWIPKMHENLISFCSIKPFSKDLASIFKLFHKKVERYFTKGKVWSGIKTFMTVQNSSGIKTFWTIQNSYWVISSINKLNNCKAAKSMTIFNFSMLYTKIPHDKLLYILNEITDFAFKGGTRDYVDFNPVVFWSMPKSKTGRSYSPQEIKCLEFLINNRFFEVGSKIFCQVIGIPRGSDPASFFANLFLFFCESRWLKSIKNTNYGSQENLAIYLGLFII